MMNTRIVITGLQKILNNLTELERKRAVLASKASMDSIGRKGKKLERTEIQRQNLMDTTAMLQMTDYKSKARRDQRGHFAVIGQKPHSIPIVGSKKTKRVSMVLNSIKSGRKNLRRQPVKYNYMVERGTSHSRAFHFVRNTENVLKPLATSIAVEAFKKYLRL